MYKGYLIYGQGGYFVGMSYTKEPQWINFNQTTEGAPIFPSLRTAKQYVTTHLPKKQWKEISFHQFKFIGGRPDMFPIPMLIGSHSEDPDKIISFSDT